MRNALYIMNETYVIALYKQKIINMIHNIQ